MLHLLWGVGLRYSQSANPGFSSFEVGVFPFLHFGFDNFIHFDSFKMFETCIFEFSDLVIGFQTPTFLSLLLLDYACLLLFVEVFDSSLSNCEDGLCFRQTWRVINLADSGLSSSFSQIKSRGAGMGHDVSSNGLLGIPDEHS